MKKYNLRNTDIELGTEYRAQSHYWTKPGGKSTRRVLADVWTTRSEPRYNTYGKGRTMANVKYLEVVLLDEATGKVFIPPIRKAVKVNEALQRPWADWVADHEKQVADADRRKAISSKLAEPLTRILGAPGEADWRNPRAERWSVSVGLRAGQDRATINIEDPELIDKLVDFLAYHSDPRSPFMKDESELTAQDRQVIESVTRFLNFEDEEPGDG
jgi:hypothetical protein